MKRIKNTSGFTLLEIIIVIIIVGVLASLALPRLFATIEFSRSTEAMSSMTSIRSSMERCYLMSLNYVNCDTFVEIDVEDPALSPNAHFGYTMEGLAANYTITARRNAIETGDGTSLITVTQDGATITKSGTGKFASIK